MLVSVVAVMSPFFVLERKQKRRSVSMTRYREEVINIRIADILREIGLEASGEIISKGKLPDIMVEINGIRVNIEGKFEGGGNKKTLRENCRKRVEEGICDVAIGLIYSKELQEAKNDDVHKKKIKQSEFQTFIFSISSKGIEERDLGKMGIERVVENIYYIYSEIINTDLVKEQVKKVNDVIQKSSEIALSSSLFFSSKKLKRELEKALGIKEISGTRKKTAQEELIKIALFIIFDGLVFHQTLSSHRPEIQSLDKSPENNIFDFIKEEWKKIIKINYLPIFSLAFSTIKCFPVSPESNKIFKILIEEVLNVISSGILLKHDLMGRVYHRLLLKTMGKYYAAYYTSIPAAWLLSNLTIKTPNPDLNWDFRKLEKLKEFQIIDPACGSGTLLSGIYLALKDKYILESYRIGNINSLDLKSFHKLLIEEVLNGWDILDYAGHLTLTTLAFHNPNAFFKHSNIYTLPTGETGAKHPKIKEVALGSLDFLDASAEQTLPMKGFINLPVEKGMAEEREKPIKVLPHSMDVVIMNPPFSRSAQPNIKFGYMGKETMRKMNIRLRKLGKKLGYEKIGQAGLGAYFIILADKLLKQGGRLALVIPRSILSGVSWKEIREKIFLSKCEVEYIISNYDPGDKKLDIEPWNWSENTNLGEVLIIARKTNDSFKKSFTTFVNLWNKPKNEIESLKIVSDSIKVRKEGEARKFLEDKGSYQEIYLNNKNVGTVYNLSQEHLKRNFLMPCIFSFPDLNKFLFNLVNNNLVPLVSLKDSIENIGMDIKQIEQIFKKTTNLTKFPIVWGYSENLNTLELKNFQYAIPRVAKVDTIYNQNAGNLLIAERIWTNTSKIISMISPKPILATQFWEISLKDPIEEKILSLWLNSTFGFLLFLASAISNRQDRFTFKKEQVKSLPVLNISVLSNNVKKNLVEFFEEIKDIPFNPIPQEFELASKGKGIRRQIDEKFINALNLKICLCPYYEMLAREPIISLKRR